MRAFEYIKESCEDVTECWHVARREVAAAEISAGISGFLVGTSYYASATGSPLLSLEALLAAGFGALVVADAVGKISQARNKHSPASAPVPAPV